MTEKAFLDTNIILRILLGDEPNKAQRCLELLRRAERQDIQLITSELVIAEVVWILQTRRYGLSRDKIRSSVLPIIQIPGLKLANKALYSQIFDLYVQHNIDFIDAYNVVVMQQIGLKEIFSYDGDFDRVTGITRLEP